jgi:fibronectin-binding autotransporter adhesin
MANYFARKAGNINATDVWATTPAGSAADVWSTFTSSDVLHSNNFAITVNVSTTVGEVRNDNANSATAGGSFTLSNGVTLTADVFAGTTACVIFSAATPNSASVVGDVLGGTGTNAFGISNSSNGTINVTGNVSGNTGQQSWGVSNSGGGIANITGNVTGGPSGTNPHGINNASGTTNITGNVTGSAAGAGANNASTSMTITGNVTGGGAIGAVNASTGTLTIVGSALAGNTGIGANNNSTGTLIATRAVGNTWGIGAAGGVNSVVGVASANVGSDTRVEELEYGTNGQAPTSGAVKVVSGTNNKCLVTLTTSAVKTLADPSDGTGQANEADVRSGTSYALGNKTGTCAVPAAGSVALGVAVDATTGTAVLTPAAVWDALTSGMTTSGSIGARLKNAATLDSTGQQLADALSPVP